MREETRRESCGGGREEKREGLKFVARRRRMHDSPYTSCLVRSGLREGGREDGRMKNNRKNSLFKPSIVYTYLHPLFLSMCNFCNGECFYAPEILFNF